MMGMHSYDLWDGATHLPWPAAAAAAAAHAGGGNGKTSFA